MMISISFKNPIQYQHERWLLSFPLRLGNYAAAWDIVAPYLVNTLIVAVIGFVGVVILSTLGAYVFAQMEFPFKETLYFAIIILLMIPWVISFIPAYMLYAQFKVFDIQVRLLNTFWVLIIPNIASGPVFGIFLLRAFFSSISKEIYEAARVDGAGHWILITRITVPLSLPVIATLTVINFIGTWNSFLWPLVTISDQTKQMISVGLFQLSNAYSRSADNSVWGPLFAGYVIASIPLALLFVGLGKFYVEGLVESGLKV
ncbi:MAG: carbohydrate ABC transporter permease [Anaerolineae bacterium]|nr:carbohydrate ABC transporter permease [Anaerolineae bacterium]